MESKKRATKVSHRQQNAMLDFIIGTRKMQIKGDNLKNWQELANILNDMPSGATKTAEQWRRCFIEWKSKVKKKARDIRLFKKGTEGGPGVSDLTDTEVKLISVCGEVTILGDKEVPEGGVEDINEGGEIEIENLVAGGMNSGDELETIIILNDKENDEPKQPHSVQSTPNAGQKKRKYEGKRGNLNATLREYASTSKKFSSSIDNLAASINKLAESNFAIAKSLDRNRGCTFNSTEFNL